MSKRNMNLSNLPAGWVSIQLGDVVKFEYGKGLVKNKRDPSGEYVVYGSNGPVGRHSEYLVKTPCLVVGRKGSAGEVHISKKPCWPIDTTYYVVPPGGIILPFLFYLFKTLNLSSFDKSTAIPGLNRYDAYVLKICLAPLPEQHRIVAKIEELFTKLDTGKEELLQAKARLKRYRQSVLKAAMDGKLTEDWRKKHGNEIEPASVLLDRILTERREKWEAEQLEQMSAKGKMPKDDKWENKYKEPQRSDTSKLPKLPEGWIWVTLPQIGELNRGKSKHRPRNASFLYGGRYPFVQTGDIKQANGLIGHYNQTYSEEGLKQSRLWPAGTLCITIAANIADTAILGFDACFPDSVVGFLSEIGQCNIRFVEFFLRTAKEDLERYAPATAQKNINLGTLKDLAIPFPPLAEQNVITEEIDRYLSVADAVEAVVDAELKRSDALRQSILKQAFSGKLVPQDPNDEPAEKLLERIKKEKTKREAEQKTNSKTKKQLALFEH